MYRILGLPMMMLFALGLPACQTDMQMPWQRSSTPPPVELMDGASTVPPPTVVPESGIPLSSEQRFKDVPLPTGIKEDFERSYVYESSTLQIGRMVYTSRSQVNELANFYIKEAPLGGWQLQSALQAQGGQTLLFTKPGKRLEVRVQEQGVGRSTLLVLNLTPEGPGL